MKTDLEKFVELYRSFDIECKVNIFDDRQTINLCGDEEDEEDRDGTVSPKLIGHFHFYSNVCFDVHGKFVSQGFWE